MKLSLVKRLLSSYVAKHGPIMKSHLIRVVVQIQSIRVRFSKGCDELAETIVGPFAYFSNWYALLTLFITLVHV